MSRRPASNNLGRRWMRRCHRWLGIVVFVFLLMLATTGLALNHTNDWRLGRLYVNWPWLLDAYGIHTPLPAASFTDREYRATLLADLLYFDGALVAEGETALTGLVVVGAMAVAGLHNDVLVMTTSGEVVERIDLSHRLVAPIERLGRLEDVILVESGGRLLISDPDITGFATPADSLRGASMKWSKQSAVPTAELETLNELYRGRGITVERLLGDIHSGRIVNAAGRLVMDIVAVLMILLSVSGVVLWFRGIRRDGAAVERRLRR